MAETNTNIYAQFIEFRKSVKQPSKSKDGFNYQYADLPTLQESVNKAMPEGLNYFQDVKSTLDDVAIQTVFFNSEGDSIKSGELHLPQTKGGKMNNIQAIGSTITYGRRYQLSAMAGISSEDDDDAKSFSQGQQQARQSPPQQKRQSESKITSQQIKAINSDVSKLAASEGLTVDQVMKKHNLTQAKIASFSKSTASVAIQKLNQELQESK